MFKTRQVYLPIPSSAETWKIVAKKVCQSFFALADILSEKSLYFGKHLFAKQELITRARRRRRDFATGKNFSFNHCHNNEFCVFSQTSSRVCITVSNSPNPSRVYIRLCKHGKRFLLLKYRSISHTDQSLFMYTKKFLTSSRGMSWTPQSWGHARGKRVQVFLWWSYEL